MTTAVRYQTLDLARHPVALHGASGRSYRATGATIDIPLPDGLEIHQPEYFSPMIMVGTTADRLATPMPSGQRGRLPYLDTTLSATVTWTGAAWINSSGTAV
jgi:hypothetical protein